MQMTMLKEREKILSTGIDAIANIDGSEGAQAIIELVDSMGYEHHQIRSCLRNIGRPALKPFEYSLNHRNWRIRKIALDILGDTKNVIYKKRFEEKIDDIHYEVVDSAILNLEKLGWAPKNEKELVLQYIVHNNVEKCYEMGQRAIKPLRYYIEFIPDETECADRRRLKKKLADCIWKIENEIHLKE